LALKFQALFASDIAFMLADQLVFLITELPDMTLEDIDSVPFHPTRQIVFRLAARGIPGFGDPNGTGLARHRRLEFTRQRAFGLTDRNVFGPTGFASLGLTHRGMFGPASDRLLTRPWPRGPSYSSKLMRRLLPGHADPGDLCLPRLLAMLRLTALADTPFFAFPLLDGIPRLMFDKFVLTLPRLLLLFQQFPLTLFSMRTQPTHLSVASSALLRLRLLHGLIVMLSIPDMRFTLDRHHNGGSSRRCRPV
jgi:hypothetical protein